MLIFAISSLLFSNALTLSKEKAIFYSRTTILALLVTSFICYDNLYVMNLEKGIGLYGGIFNITSLTQNFNIFIFLISSIILIYNSFYHRILNTPKSILQALKGGSVNTPNKESDKALSLNLADTNLDQYKIIEYPLIILFIICGAVFLMTSGDLISLFISIELQSYGLYILSTLHRDSEQATWGGLTYFLLGGLSSCFILLGSALIYINTGTTSLDGIYIINSITDMTSNIELIYSDYLGGVLGNDISNYSALPVNIFDWHYINISLTLLCVGFLFKISAAPFHFWSPDVYDAIPTTVTTFVAIIAKLSIFIVLLQLVYFMSKDLSIYSWKNCLLLSSLFSLIVGSVLGLTQYRIKRVYAYSTISHVGFILLALSVDSTESIQAFIFYILTYTISNLNAFVILVTIGYTMYLYVYNDDKVKSQEAEASRLLQIISNKGALARKNLKDLVAGGQVIKPLNAKSISLDTDYINTEGINNTKGEIESLKNTIENSNKYISYDKTHNNIELKDVKYSPIQLVNQLKGYFYINSYLSLSLAITLFSFIGIPPLVGFFAKQMVLSAALDNGYIFITLVGILTSVIGAVYYLNIVKQMFFFKSDYVINPFLKTLGGGFPREINNVNYITISSALSIAISVMTLLLLLFIFIPNESFNLAKILTLTIFN